MKCWVEEEQFRPAWKAIQPTEVPEEGPVADLYYTGIIRVEADAGAMTMRGPFGQARIPADVERPGVLFVSFREFIEAMSNPWGETRLVLEAYDGEYARTENARFLSQPWEFAVFDDPATAPDAWEPAEPAEEDWEEEEEEAA